MPPKKIVKSAVVTPTAKTTPAPTSEVEIPAVTKPVLKKSKTDAKATVGSSKVTQVDAGVDNKKPLSFAEKAANRTKNRPIIPTTIDTKAQQMTTPVPQPAEDSDSDYEEAPTVQTDENKRQAPVRTFKKMQVWMDIQAVPIDLGRIIIELYPDCPLAYENFRALCTGEYTDPYTNEILSYRGSFIDQIEDDYIVLGNINPDDEGDEDIKDIQSDEENDLSNDENDLTEDEMSTKNAQKSKTPKVHYNPEKPAKSIYGGYFPDEEAGLRRNHVKPGTVSMFNSKSNKNGTKFLITLKPHMKWLDGQYTVIGHVTDGLKSMYSLQAYKPEKNEFGIEIEDDEDMPTCVISNCGRYKKRGNGKFNEFLQAAVEKVSEKKPEQAPIEKKCPTCQSTKVKYVSRDLKKHVVKYYCKNEECKATFTLAEAKYDHNVVDKALELKKNAKEQQQHEFLLATSKKYQKKFLKGMKKDGKSIEEINTTLSKMNEIKDKNENPIPKKFASPNIITEIQHMLVKVAEHKKEKRQKFEKSKKDRIRFLEGKEYERENVEEQLVQLEKEYKDAELDFKRHMAATESKNDKKRKNPPSSDDNFIKRGKSNNKNKQQPTFTDAEFQSMDKQTRRIIRRELNLPSGPSKTEPTNANKKRLDPTDYKNHRMGKKTGNVQKTGEKKEKIRWREKDTSTLPTEFVQRLEAKKERKAAAAAHKA